MKKNPYLHSFRSLFPPHSRSQEDLVSWMLRAHERTSTLRGEGAIRPEVLERFCLRPLQVGQRYFECDEIDGDWEDHEIYRLTEESPQGSDLMVRNLFYKKVALRVLGEIYDDCPDLPDHLIHVSCTGYTSPSAPQAYFSEKKAPNITHAYHMGCYASMPAVRMARALVNSEEADLVDIVHNEVCGLHMDSSVHTPEQMVVQSLFADGHIKYRMSKEPHGRCLKVFSVKEKLLPDSGDAMTWIPGPFGMKMSLSKEVPARIKGSLAEFVLDLCKDSKLDWRDFQESGLLAIHPGGPKIIESTQRLLEMRDDQVAYSQQVLKQRGNMSSATLPHVWKAILDGNAPAGTKVMGLTFGPGLTVFGTMMEVMG
jgi:predicted naringenin-chalcone synthase